MTTMITAIALGIAMGTTLKYTGAASQGWSIFWGIIFMLAIQLAAGLFIRREVNRVNRKIQNEMTEMQRKLNRKMEAFQRRPGASVKAMQEELIHDQHVAIRHSLDMLNELNKYVWFNYLLDRQLNTMRVVMLFQLKEFDKVDKIMPKAMMITAQAIAIKMTRMFKNNDPKLDDFFRKKSRKLKGDDAVLIFSLYAWIKIHQDDAKSALDALNLAMTKCDHPVITANRDRIANGKIKQFSNAQLGDAWYALYLEEPKIKQQRMERRFA